VFGFVQFEAALNPVEPVANGIKLVAAVGGVQTISDGMTLAAACYP
jgi:hypothetical protein